MSDVLISMILENRGKATVVLDSKKKVDVRIGLGAVFAVLKEKGEKDRCLMAPLQENAMKNALKASELIDELTDVCTTGERKNG